MTFNNAPDNDEKPNASDAPGPFDPKNEKRIAELNEKFEKPIVVNNPKLSENFPGSVILKKPDGTHFAVRKTENGWEGNSFKLTPDGTIGATYQERDIEPGLIMEAEAQIEKGANEKLNVFKQDAIALYRKGGYEGQAFNTFSGQPSKEAVGFKKKLTELSEQEQQKIAESFFEDTIGQSISNNGNAYLVYMATRGTAFARKFAEMEDARLKSAGYSGFTI